LFKPGDKDKDFAQDRLPALLFCISGALKTYYGIKHTRTLDEKYLEVSLRMVGRQVLLNSGDSTSRVLPIIKRNDRYKIESEFEFNPEELVYTYCVHSARTSSLKWYPCLRQ